MKRILFCAALAASLAAWNCGGDSDGLPLLGCAGEDCAQGQSAGNPDAPGCIERAYKEAVSLGEDWGGGIYELNVVYRDFSSDEYGFQEYDQSRNPRRCAEKANQGAAYMASPRNGICFSNGIYHSCDMGGTSLRYGADNCDRGPRGYTNVPNTMPGAIPSKNENCWDQEIVVTRGMVRNELDYSQCGVNTNEYPMNNWQGVDSDPIYIRGMTCARPMPSGAPQNEACYGENVHEWFTSGGRAKTIDELTLELRNRSNAAIYEIEYSYNVINSEWGDNGFFPLDRFANDGYKTYGKQNRNAWDSNTNGTDGCTRGQSCTDNNDGKAHNYGFSMAGSGMFKYNSTASANDIFEFVGDDDMWIFIDGRLFEDMATGAHGDLGGHFLPAPAMIDIASYARQEGWPNDSWHVINFFYMERQTDGSNLKISMKLNELAPALNSFPRIIKTETRVDANGNAKTLLFVSSQLDMNSINPFVSGGASYGWPVVVSTNGDIRGYSLTSIGNERRGEGGYIYDIVGYICDDASCSSRSALYSGDSLSFNTIYPIFEEKNLTIDRAFALSDESKYIKNRAGKPADISWGQNTTARMHCE